MTSCSQPLSHIRLSDSIKTLIINIRNNAPLQKECDQKCDQMIDSINKMSIGVAAQSEVTLSCLSTSHTSTSLIGLMARFLERCGREAQEFILTALNVPLLLTVVLTINCYCHFILTALNASFWSEAALPVTGEAGLPSTSYFKMVYFSFPVQNYQTVILFCDYQSVLTTTFFSLLPHMFY